MAMLCPEIIFHIRVRMNKVHQVDKVNKHKEKFGEIEEVGKV